jgi:hypothetical protein
MDIQQIYEDALKDPSLLSTIDVDKLLDSLENTNNDYLTDHTLETIQKEVHDILKQNGIVKIQEYCEKLATYRYVDEICELHKGKNIRWIRIDSPEKKLTNGGIVVDIKFLDNGTHVLCMNNQQRFIQYKFDDCITFQKLSMEEQLILMSYDFL